MCLCAYVFMSNMNTRAHKHMNTSKGFTLVELVLVIALMGILAAVLGPALERAVRQYDLISSRKQTLAQARAAMDRMVKEIRLIQSSADVTDVSSSTSFQFQYPHGTAITYDLNSTNLRRNTVTLASPLSALTFSYFDSAGSATSVAANVRRVQILFTITAPHNNGSLTLQTSAYLRSTDTDYANLLIQ